MDTVAVLHTLADLGEADILAIVTNRKDPGNASAAAVDVINTWYGRGDIPIGTVINQWPTLIPWQGYEVGAAMDNGAELQSAPKTSPVRRAYE